MLKTNRVGIYTRSCHWLETLIEFEEIAEVLGDE